MTPPSPGNTRKPRPTPKNGVASDKRERPKAPYRSERDEWPAGGGELGALMRRKDWSKTRLGPVQKWPKSLKTMLGMILGSRFPMMIWWGPNLFNFYNDAYRPILRDKHPASLGAPAAELWAEIWDFAGPLARGVLEGGPATWMEDVQLFIKSGDMTEETYFTFSYSPIPGDDGGIGGLLNTVQETTVKVRSERQIRMLRDLAARAGEAKSAEDAYRLVAETLSANELDLPFLLIYVLDEKAGEARLAAAGGWKDYEGPAKPARTPVRGDGNGAWPFAEAVRAARDIVVEDLSSRFGPLPEGRWNARPDRAVVLPLSRAGGSAPQALMVAGVSPHRALDDRYRGFFRAAADQAAGVIAGARAYEEERRRAEALAEIDRAKTAFFSNVSHEFRTPLTLILGPVEDALRQDRGTLEGEALRAVHRSALRLLRLVNSLLDFSRAEAGRVQASFEPLDLAAFTRGLADSFRSLVESSGMALTVDCPPLPQPVFADRSQWEKIVLNLLSNAFKFTFKGSITVRLRAVEGRAALTVQDTGTGIPAQELPRVFERFHRVEGARGRSFEGTGIGLAFVQELVRQHGGSVGVESVLDKGSTFTVSIPFGRDHLPQDRIVPERSGEAANPASPYLLEAEQWNGAAALSVKGTEALLPASGGTEGRILVVDDSADMREYVVRLLRTRWDVDAVPDGNAALERLRTSPPDLVLSDVMMPGMDGFALLRAIRGDPALRAIPVVLLSARAGEEAVTGGLESGADDYLVKPFSARELLVRVRTHLDMARTRRAAEAAATELAETRASLLADLESKNKELESFSYSVAHDLRAPLRSIDGFSQAVLEDFSDKLGPEGRDSLQRVRGAARHMGELIEGLLNLSRLSRREMRWEKADLSALAREILQDLQKQDPGRRVETVVAAGLTVQGDNSLLRAVLENLLGNAWKFTSKRSEARIELGGTEGKDGKAAYFIRDNGAGFDPQHAHKLFGVFQRLHRAADFPGTGVGLATVHRIVARHGGRIWAEGRPGEGACFTFTLPTKDETK